MQFVISFMHLSACDLCPQACPVASQGCSPDYLCRFLVERELNTRTSTKRGEGLWIKVGRFLYMRWSWTTEWGSTNQKFSPKLKLGSHCHYCVQGFQGVFKVMVCGSRLSWCESHCVTTCAPYARHWCPFWLSLCLSAVLFSVSTFFQHVLSRVLQLSLLDVFFFVVVLYKTKYFLPLT